ncbi:Oidioi.mRNA.OKI2018_I69.chr2.g6015.t1.cds [Oikopleura dioica]|uniref:Oidioi.mRNA.OKI2018_I69.chr2.g6015.t1.cds n=1 Tax=Oikopleura dioica TaxID=34765 RepID=A0ABN7T1M3_OIKDI|nr:Oidioi.mRNA.OKI2018_I69.chr2.g6015.t1.cds [Oikopleura dioica]
MAKSLRSKRMRRNRAYRAQKTGPRVLKRMVDSLEKAKVFNEAREAEKLKEGGVEMEDVTEQPEKSGDAEMVDPNKSSMSKQD